MSNERFLECLKPSDTLHFKDNFIEGKKYKVEEYGGSPCVKSEDGTRYPVEKHSAELRNMDITFEFKPMFI